MSMTQVAPAVENDSLREKVRELARSHKASWIMLGQHLYTVHKDKFFKKWGFLSFEGYCSKELSLKSATASKLLKSYYFLEKEEPRMTHQATYEGETECRVPDYESVNLLRLAKEKEQLTPQDFAEIRESVINRAKEPKEVRAQVKKLIEAREEKDPAEVRKTRRNAMLKRLLTTLTAGKREFTGDNLLPDYLLKQMDQLIEKIRDQIED